jgi:uncharacterized protein (DUF342 family)
LVEHVTELAASSGVAVPLDNRVVEATLRRWLATGKKMDAVIARGSAPRPGADAVVTLLPPRRSLPRSVETDRVQRRNLGFVTNVEKGTVLATVSPPTPGVPGKTVRGGVLAPRAGLDCTVQASALVRAETRDGVITYRAAERGMIGELTASRIEVTQRLEIRRPIDHSTGNIDAWGAVVIRGSVEGGFSVRARGEVVIDGTCESAYIESGDSVTVGGGILGRSGVTEVKCKGAFSARFVENAQVQAGGRVTVRDFVLNSRILAVEGIEIAGKGAVLSSVLAADRDVTAGTLGSEAALPVEIIVGYDPLLRRRLERMRVELRSLRRTVMKDRSGCVGPQSQRSRAQADRLTRRKRMAAVMERILLRKETSVAEAVRSAGPEVVIRTAAYPRTRLRLGPHVVDLAEVLPAGVFRVDAARGAVEWTPAGTPPTRSKEPR